MVWPKAGVLQAPTPASSGVVSVVQTMIITHEQATGEEADQEEDLEVANRNLRAALDASQQEVFEVYQQVHG